MKSGLGLVRLGLLAWMLALLAPTLLAILEQNGVPLPQQDPGLFGATGLSLATEIKVGLGLAFFTLGGLMIVAGRLRVGSVPRVSGARGLARAAAFATIIAFAAFLAALLITISAATQGAVPQLIPHTDVMLPNIKLQTRIESYVQHLFLATDDMNGQIQRYGLLAMITFGTLAELWFFGALGRIAVHLRNDRAAARVSRLVVCVGLLVALIPFVALWYDISGRQWIAEEVTPKWDALARNLKIALRAGIIGIIGLTLLFWKSRVVHAVRRTVAENSDAA